DAVGGAGLLHRPHAHRGRHGAGDHPHWDAVAGEHLDRPPGGDVGEEAPVVAAHQPPLHGPLGVHAIREPLREQAHVLPGELVPDDGSPATCAELDHARSFAHGEDALTAPATVVVVVATAVVAATAAILAGHAPRISHQYVQITNKLGEARGAVKTVPGPSSGKPCLSAAAPARAGGPRARARAPPRPRRRPRPRDRARTRSPRPARRPRAGVRRAPTAR